MRNNDRCFKVSDSGLIATKKPAPLEHGYWKGYV
ncbi:hypothetical protein [Enterococcus casseliflavus]